MLLKKTTKILSSQASGLWSLKCWNFILGKRALYFSEAKAAALSDAEGETKEAEPAKVSDEEEGKEEKEEKEIAKIEEEKFRVFSQSLFLKEQVDAIDKKLKAWNEVTPLNLFHTFLPNKTQSVGDEAVRKLNRIDFLKDHRIRISQLLKKAGENQTFDDVEKIYELLEGAFSKKFYSVLTDISFRNLIYFEETLNRVSLFYNREFFQTNPAYITNSEVVTILKKCFENPKYYPLLELVKYHRQFVDRKEHQRVQFIEKDLVSDFLEKNIKTNSFDYLSLCYHMHNLSKRTFIKQIDNEKLCLQFKNICWGSLLQNKQNEIFKHHLFDLLFLKYKISYNEPLRLFLLDVFFASDTYEKALASFSVTIRLLARLYEKKENISDLLHLFKSSFGEKKYNFYINQNLAEVLNKLTNKTPFETFQKGIKEYEGLSKGNTISLVDGTFFDSSFRKEKCLIFYDYPGVDLTDIVTVDGTSFNMFSGKTKRQHKHTADIMREALSELDSKALLTLFKENFEQNDEEMNYILKKSMSLNADISDGEQFARAVLYDIYNELSMKQERQLGKKTQIDTYKEILINQKHILNLSETLPRKRLISIVKYFNANMSTSNKKPANLEPVEEDATYDEFFNSAVAGNEKEGLDEQKQKKGSFGLFMKAAKKVDEEVRATEIKKDFDAKKKAKKQGEKVFLSKDEAKELKSLLKDEEKQRGEPETGKTRSVQFKKIEQENLKKEVLAAPQTQQPTPQQIINIEKLRERFKNVVGEKRSVSEIVPELENYFRSSSQGDAEGLIECIVNIKPLIEGVISDGEILIEKLFYQPTEGLALPIPENDRLKGELNSFYGQLEKNYNIYLKESLFNYSLGETGYLVLLECQLENYKRKYFKKVVSHILLYNKGLSDKLLQVILEIGKKEKIGLTLLEFSNLIFKNKIEITKEGFKLIVTALKDFKGVSEDILIVLQLALDTYKWDFDLSLVEPYIDSMVKFKRGDKYMFFFERAKEMILTKKVENTPDMTSDQFSALQEQMKTNQKNILHNFYRCFIEKLNKAQEKTQAKLLFDDLTSMKYTLNEEDYRNGLAACTNKAEIFQDLWKTFEVTESLKMNLDVFVQLVFAGEENSKTLGEFLEKKMKEYIFSGKLAINMDFINTVFISVAKSKNYKLFGDFIRHLIENKIFVRPAFKFVCYRIINDSKDEMSKSYLKGLVDDLFSEHNRKAVKESREKGKKAKAEDQHIEESTTSSRMEQSKTETNEIKKPETKDDEEKKKAFLKEMLKGNSDVNLLLKPREKKLKQKSFAEVKFNQVLLHLTPSTNPTPATENK